MNESLLEAQRHAHKMEQASRNGTLPEGKVSSQPQPQQTPLSTQLQPRSLPHHESTSTNQPPFLESETPTMDTGPIHGTAATAKDLVQRSRGYVKDDKKRSAEEEPESTDSKKSKQEEEDDEPVPPSDEGLAVFGDNDVLSGRGGGTNVHPGNRHFRDLINYHRRAYLKARKNDKPAISRKIVKTIRDNDGRFLKRNRPTGLWFEIGDDAAREKTSQALRQRAPEMRRILFQSWQNEQHQREQEQQHQQQQQHSLQANSAGAVEQRIYQQQQQYMQQQASTLGRSMAAGSSGGVPPELAANIAMNPALTQQNITNAGASATNGNAMPSPGASGGGGMMNPLLLNKDPFTGSNAPGAAPAPYSQMNQNIMAAAFMQAHGGLNRFASNGA